MSEGHVHVNPAGVTGEVDGRSVSFDVQPLLLLIVAACVVVTTVVIVRSYMERHKFYPLPSLDGTSVGVFPPSHFAQASDNGAKTANVKEAK